MKGTLSAALLMAAVLCLWGAASEGPAQYRTAGAITGGIATEGLAVSGVRFGEHSSYTRMVLDLEATSGNGRRPAVAHPVYRVEYYEYPYRLVVSLSGVHFDNSAFVNSKPALPFSVITEETGELKQLQVFLPGPCEFKVIEIDDPAKLCIDIRQRSISVPEVYTVQVTGPADAAEAFALVERGRFPEGFRPYALVVGDVVVVEQAFTNASAAARMDAALREMGYASVINERRGDELPRG